MKKNHLVSATLAAVLFFVSCTSTSTVFLDENYTKNSIDSEYVLLPINKDWIPEAVISSFSNEEELNFRLALEAAFKSNFENPVYTFDQELELSASDFERVSLEAENLTIEVVLPPDNLLDIIPERYVYFFEDYGFRIAEKATTGSSYVGNESQVYTVLLFQTEFYLLDTETREIISWGLVADETQIVDVPEYNHYFRVINKVTKKIAEKSPLTPLDTRSSGGVPSRE
ncbi:MAG: hypothetical protein MI700_09480 [Balneolales bacterium]|nr:hypothetical protein [Balneolales bacterium]